MLSERKNKPNCFSSFQVYNEITDEVKLVRFLRENEEYVYDIETEDGSFNCGFSLIVKNTDSFILDIQTMFLKIQMKIVIFTLEWINNQQY